MNRVSKENALKYLNRALDQATELKGLKNSDPEFQKWKTSTIQYLKRIFGNQSDSHKDFDRSLIIHRYESTGTNLDRAIALLKSKIEVIEDEWPAETEWNSDSLSSGHGTHRSSSSNKVFVVHGHDDATRERVAGFLRRLDLKPIILHEQPNKGRTIIEKFEEYADVGFAVVLLTPDDMGTLKNKQNDLKPRARQNVIFEPGYFIGKLGRGRVCPFVKDDVETPSDYDGVVYTMMDEAGAWESRLIQELNSADFDIDANRQSKT